MNELAPEQMMHYMMQSRKEAFYLMAIVYTLFIVAVVVILLLINRFLVPVAFRPLVLRIVLIFSILFYAAGITSRWKNYRHGHKNQRPWSGGIYEAYYECSKCKSLYGAESLLLNQTTVHRKAVI
jgi:hypothetical protein